MTDEEYLKNRLDRLNQNSHYGIMIDTEITNIVRSHIKRLEETKMNATSTETFHDIIAIDFELQTFPNPDVQDKFIVSATNRDDIFAFVFEGPHIADACRKTGLFAGLEKDRKIRELEEMNKNLKKHIQLQIDNNTDILKCNDELREEISRCNKVNEELGNDAVELEKRMQMYKQSQTQKIKALKKELALEKAANEAQHKFIREYAGKGTEVQFNYAIDDAKEVSYVVVEKNGELAEENKKLKQEIKDNNTKILQYIRMNYKLQDEIMELRHQLSDIQAAKEVVEQKRNNVKKYLQAEVERLREENKQLKQDNEEPADNVNHPSHYTGRYECIDVMQDVFGDEATNDFCLCNAFKYIWRARKKNGLEDVKKAVWYLSKYIEEAEKYGEDKVTGA